MHQWGRQHLPTQNNNSFYSTIKLITFIIYHLFLSLFRDNQWRCDQWVQRDAVLAQSHWDTLTTTKPRTTSGLSISRRPRVGEPKYPFCGLTDRASWVSHSREQVTCVGRMSSQRASSARRGLRASISLRASTLSICLRASTLRLAYELSDTLLVWLAYSCLVMGYTPRASISHYIIGSRGAQLPYVLLCSATLVQTIARVRPGYNR